MKIIIAGSSGLIGSALSQLLKQAGHQIIKLSRQTGGLEQDQAFWNPEQGILDPALIEDCQAVINLAGETIFGRWTQNKRKRIHDSRIQSTTLLASTIAASATPPKVFINASATAYLGSSSDETLPPQGDGFLAKICQAWELAAEPAAARARCATLRTGVVLSPNGGALKSMLPIFKLGLGGKLGSGDQLMNWIAIDDAVRAIEYILTHESCEGPFNLVSPNPVTNGEFTKTLGKLLNRPTIFPLPAFMARVIFGELADEILLNSAHIKPGKLLNHGYAFQHPQLEEALGSLLKN